MKVMPVLLEERWLSVDEIAVHLGIKRDTVYKWIAEKHLPTHRLGRLWKFKRDEVDSWVRSGAAGTVTLKEKAKEGKKR